MKLATLGVRPCELPQFFHAWLPHSNHSSYQFYSMTARANRSGEEFSTTNKRRIPRTKFMKHPPSAIYLFSQAAQHLVEWQPQPGSEYRCWPGQLTFVGDVLSVEGLAIFCVEYCCLQYWDIVTYCHCCLMWLYYSDVLSSFVNPQIPQFLVKF